MGLIVVDTKKCLGGKSHSTVDRHNMMEGSALRDEELKIRTFVFQFLGLVCIVPGVGVGSVLFIVTPGYCTSTPARNTLTYQH